MEGIAEGMEKGKLETMLQNAQKMKEIGIGLKCNQYFVEDPLKNHFNVNHSGVARSEDSSYTASASITA